VPRASNYKLNIGRNPGYGEHFQGLVDEVSVYSRALAGNEIAAITSAATASKCKNPGSADLSIAQTVPTVTQIGRHLTNDIVVVNQGPDIALATHVAFTLPAGASVVASESGPGSWILATGQAGYALGDLNPGATATLRLVLNPTLAGSLTNALTVSSLAGDPNVANNTSVRETLVYRYYTPDDGDWDANSVMLYNTTEASLMVRSGDIDNLGFGWPAGFNPFSGNSTPGHTFPWAAPTNAPAGTDRIMVVSSYEGRPPKGQDGYTGSTSRPANEVEAVQLEYELGGIPVTSAALQLFVDDFQAPVWGASYTVRLNGVRAPFLETIINALAQTGPIGKLISANFPTEFLPLLLTNRLEILIDDTTTGAGDGFAIDFAKLLINVRVFGQVGTIQGQVVDSANQQPIPGVRVSAAGYAGATDTTGHYVLANIPAGLAPVEASHPDYIPQIKPTDLVTGNTNTVAFSLVVQPRLRVENHHGQAVISWPVSLSGYSLQTTPSLSPAASWVSEGTTPTVILERNTVTNSLADRQQFYRLSKP
jgi:hypothetical protein